MWSTLVLYCDGLPVYEREIWLHNRATVDEKAFRRKQVEAAVNDIKKRFAGRINTSANWQLQLTIQSKASSALRAPSPKGEGILN